jgi:hypothetical protein
MFVFIKFLRGGLDNIVFHNTGMRRLMMFQSTTDHVYDCGPIRLWYYNIILYYFYVTIAYSIQYSNTLYSFVA